MLWLELFILAGAVPNNCQLGTATVKLDGKDARVSDEPCSIPGVFELKNYYVDLVGGKTVLILLEGFPSAYDSTQPAFDKFVKTIKFTK
jgi:hypothetical protein